MTSPGGALGRSSAGPALAGAPPRSPACSTATRARAGPPAPLLGPVHKPPAGCTLAGAALSTQSLCINLQPRARPRPDRACPGGSVVGPRRGGDSDSSWTRRRAVAAQAAGPTPLESGGTFFGLTVGQPAAVRPLNRPHLSTFVPFSLLSSTFVLR